MSSNKIHVPTDEALEAGYGQTKYGVLEVGGEDYSDSTLRSKTSAVTCPVCQEALCPAEQFGGLLVCPKHGTAPFETTR